MGSRAKITYSYIKEYINSKETGNGCNLITEETEFMLEKSKQNKSNSQTKIEIRCSCGNIFITCLNSFKSNNQKQCSKCGVEIRAGNRRKTTESFKAEIFNIVGKEYSVLGEYTNDSTKIKIRHNCNKCNNYEYEVVPNRFLQGTRCPSCNGGIKKSNEDFSIQIHNILGSEYSILEQYENSNKKILVRHNCDDCNNNEWKISPSKLLNGRRCPICQQKLRGKPTKTLVILKEEFYSLVKDEYSILSYIYINSHTKISVKHNICGSIYDVTPSNFLKGRRCPICKESKGEQTIRSWLTDNDIPFLNEYEFKDLVGVSGKNLRFDFTVFKDEEKTKIKFIIEYDGEFHYFPIMGQARLNKQQEYDRRKNKYCKLHNIDLLRIPYWDFDNIENILNEKLNDKQNIKELSN